MSRATLKGQVGEDRVWRWANTLLPRSRYTHFHDLWLPGAQIDHVFLSRNGVFVVETKNYDGWISGHAGDDNWTQIFGNRARFSVRNPLRQNEWHVRVLARVLEPSRVRSANLHSVVALVGAAKVKTALPSNVKFGKDFAHYIRSFNALVLSETQVDMVRGAIDAARVRPQH